MIQIIDKHKCCGCSACVQACPKHCISYSEDAEGFCYPKVDASLCIDCHLCEKVCPFINTVDQDTPIAVYAATNPEEKIRIDSSSGGIFTMLAERIIKTNGVVFGATYDDKWEVHHSYTNSIDSVGLFRGSKYVQSRIEHCYIETRKFLLTGKTVLFSGTPCQIAGLINFLGKKYSNLITVDVVCHGVPSPLIWREYLNNILKVKNISYCDITNISFRDKRNGWERYGFSLSYKTEHGIKSFYEYRKNNIYLNGYLSDVFLRPSCYTCPVKNGKSQSDITLADFWGVKETYPLSYSEKGVSSIIVHTEKGKSLLKSINVSKQNADLNIFIQKNPAYKTSKREPSNRKRFWKSLNKKGAIYALKKEARLPYVILLRYYVIKLLLKAGIHSLRK